MTSTRATWGFLTNHRQIDFVNKEFQLCGFQKPMKFNPKWEQMRQIQNFINEYFEAATFDFLPVFTVLVN